MSTEPGKWIAVSDDKPPKMHKVLLYWDGFKETDVGYYKGPNIWLRSDKNPWWTLPTQWMILPSPPKPPISNEHT